MSEKASELNASIQDSVRRLAELVDEQRASEEMRRHLDFMARFHGYSWGNCVLIAAQQPDATMVAGFTQWKRMGRNIRRAWDSERRMTIHPPPVD